MIRQPYLRGIAPGVKLDRQFTYVPWRPLVRRARGHRTRRAPGGAGQGLPVFPARGAAEAPALKAGPGGAVASRCAAALTLEGRPRTLARRVPRPRTRQPSGKGERRRSRLLRGLGRAAAGRAHAASSLAPRATGLGSPAARCAAQTP